MHVPTGCGRVKDLTPACPEVSVQYTLAIMIVLPSHLLSGLLVQPLGNPYTAGCLSCCAANCSRVTPSVIRLHTGREDAWAVLGTCLCWCPNHNWTTSAPREGDWLLHFLMLSHTHRVGV